MFVAFFPVIEVRSFDYDDITLDVNKIFQFQEEAVKEGYLTENVSIQLDLPSESWNIQDIELNFTEINFEPEMKNIENNTLASSWDKRI